MKVRFSIERLVIDGVELSPGERAQLEEQLRKSLHAVLLARLAVAQRQPSSLPVARNARRELIELESYGPFAREHLGKALGASLVSHMWGGAPWDLR